MPLQSRRRMIIRQARKKRKKQAKSIILPQNQKRELKQFIASGQFRLEARNDRGFMKRRLIEVEVRHEKDFTRIVADLRRRFKNRQIEVLDEGAGNSTFIEELSGKSPAGTINGTKTDIRYGSGKDPNAISPEQLVDHFGKERFHLIVSTFGGTTYTSISQEKALANIIQCLKTGGMASIVLGNNDFFTHGRKFDAATIEKMRKLYPHIQITVREIEYPDSKTMSAYQIVTIYK